MPTSTRSRTRRGDRDALCLLTATPDEAALAIACSLPTATDLLHLALTCQRFSARRVRVANTGHRQVVPPARVFSVDGRRVDMDAERLAQFERWQKIQAGELDDESDSSGDEQPASPEPATEANAAPTAAWSFAEEAARLWLLSHGSQQRDWVPRRERESWLGLMHELQLLQRPLMFDRRPRMFGGKVIDSDASQRVDGEEVPDLSTVKMFGDEVFCCAASKQVMRAGRHFVEFKLCTSSSANPDVAFGLIRPFWPVETELSRPVWRHPDHCFYSTFNGERFSSPGAGCEWLGQSGAVVGDRIGLLLDLDQGSVSVFKNGNKLGVMDHQKLFGEWSWSVAMYDYGDRVQISSPSLVDTPPSPTEEELATAKRWWTKNTLQLQP
jgi:hypothetical protein